MAALSAPNRESGGAFVVRTTPVFAFTNQSVNWVLKSAGEVNVAARSERGFPPERGAHLTRPLLRVSRGITPA